MLKILLLDDDSECLESLGVALSFKGYDCKQFTEPHEALEEFSNNQYDVVITDYKMPGMNGIELMKACREIRADQQVIVITAFAEAIQPVEAREYGARELLLKPLDIKLLLRTLGEIERELSNGG